MHDSPTSHPARLATTVALTVLASTTFAFALAQDDSAAADGDPIPIEVTEATNYVGAVDDDLFVAIDVLTPSDPSTPWPLAVYLCDGSSVSTWLTGAFDGAEGRVRSDAATVEVTVDDDRAYGTIVLGDGSSRLFVASRTSPPPTGLYRANGEVDGDSFVGGWIELPDGRQRGAITVGGEIVATPSLDASSGEIGADRFGGTLGCCCGVVAPCSLECCAMDDSLFEPPSATPSPN